MCIYILVMCMYVLVCDTVLNACTGERGVQTHIQATVYYKTFKNLQCEHLQDWRKHQKA